VRIVVVGTGRLGSAVGRLFVRCGHDVAVASRDPERGRRAAAALGRRAEAVPLSRASARGDLALLATLWENTRHAVEAGGPYDGRILIDATNPESEDGRSLAVGHTTSGAEMIAGWAPDARVVKAFNHTYAELLDAGPAFSGGPASVLLCGDDRGARAAVAGLVASCGFDPVDAGPLASARYLEPVAALFVELVRGGGRHDPSGIAFGIFQREKSPPDPSLSKGKETSHAAR
jgi:predicted dinucleotide-binding enzyme